MSLLLSASLVLGFSFPALAGDPLVLAESTAEQPPVLRCHLVLNREAIVVDGVQVLTLEERRQDGGATVLAVPDGDKRGQLIAPLYDRLLDRREQEVLDQAAWRSLAVLTQREELARDGELLVSVDVDTPFSVLREALYTAGQARYGSFLFVTHNPWLDALGAIEVTLPAIGPPRGVDIDGERLPLTLSVVVDDQGIDILGADRVLEPAGAIEPDDEGPALPCAGACAGVDDYDWAGLSRMLGLIKDEFPDNLTVIVLPESQVPFEVVVRVLDTARWAPHLPLDAEHEDWEHWRGLRRWLFPWAVLAGGAV